MIANSQHTKKPLSPTRAPMTASLPNKMPGESQSSAMASANGAAAKRKIDIMRVVADVSPALCKAQPTAASTATTLPARLGHARDEPLRSKLAEGETRNL